MAKKSLPSFFQNDDFYTKSGIFVSKNDIMQFHVHQHDYFEFEYISNGHGMQLINGEKSEINAGDVLFITPSDFHGYMSDKVFNTTTIHFSEESVGDRFRDIISGAGASIIHNAPLSLIKEIGNLYDIYNSNNSWTELRLINCLERILIDFFSIRNRSLVVKKVYDKMTDVIGYINRNYRNNITAGSVSEMFYMSPEYFSKMFKARTGTGFVSYITEKRLDFAKKLLRGGASITDVSYESGFGSERNFSRQFHKHFGMSPSEYKKVQKMS